MLSISLGVKHGLPMDLTRLLGLLDDEERPAILAKLAKKRLEPDLILHLHVECIEL